MAYRNGHGKGSGRPHIETLPVDELPVGVPDPKRGNDAPIERDELGRLADKASAANLGRLGGQAKAGETRLARRLALGDSFADPRFEPYARSARAFRRAQVARLARDVGGGQCGPAPSSIIASAALQLAGSRFAFEVLGDMALGSRLADASRQNLLAAHELCAREALARPKAPADAAPWLVAADGPPQGPQGASTSTETPTGETAPTRQPGASMDGGES